MQPDPILQSERSKSRTLVVSSNIQGETHMSTMNETPTLLERSAEPDYSIVAWESNGDECQREDLTFEEYDHLRKHLANRRGLTLVEDAEPNTAATPEKPTEPDSDTETAPASTAKEIPEPKTKAAELAVAAFDACIGEIECKRDVMLQCQHVEGHVQDALVESLMLKDILNSWGSGDFVDEFPGEPEIISAIRGTLKL
jgi:hypothetical protein